MKKLMASVLAAAMCFSCTMFTGIVQAQSSGAVQDSAYQIKFTQPAANGTLTATVGGEAITTGAKVEKDKVVTFTV